MKFRVLNSEFTFEKLRHRQFTASLVFSLLIFFHFSLVTVLGATHVTATYDLGTNPRIMATVNGNPEYGLVYVQRNKSVTYAGTQYGTTVLKGYLDASGRLNDGAGTLWLDLIPNTTASPADSMYVVTVNIQGQVHAELWVVPEVTTVDAIECRASQPPSPVPPGMFYQTVQQSGTDLPQRSKLNFTGSGVNCADNAAALTTDCTMTGGAGSGITTLNSLNATSQSFATATSGTDFNIVSSGSTHTFHLPTASGAARGLLSASDWTAFNSKESALTFNTPLSRAVNAISCPSCEVTGSKNAASGYAGLTSAGRLNVAQGQEVWSVTDLTDYTATSGTGETAIRATITTPATNDVLAWSGSNWVNQAAPGGGGGYCTIQEEGSGLAVRSNLNFIGPAVTAADDAVNARTNVTISASGTGNCSTNQFVTGLNNGAAPNCAQLGFTNLSGSATKSQLPSVAVFTDQANTWTAGAQDFGAAASLKTPTAAGAAPATSGLIAYDSSANVFKGGANSATKTFAFTDSNITGTAANITEVASAAHGGTGANNTATPGRYLRGDGTNFVTSSVAAAGAGACADQFARTLNDNATPTCATVGAADIAISSPSGAQLSGVASANLATANKTIEKSVVIFSPAITDTNLVQLYFGQAVTLARLACSTDAGTVDINFDKRAEATPNSAGTNVLSANLSCTTTTGTTTTFASSAVSADSPLNLQIASTSGAPGVVRIHVKATVN